MPYQGLHLVDVADWPADDFFATYHEVAGTRHQDDVQLGSVFVGDQVELSPEPTNKFDPNAIEVLHSSKMRLGYVPKPYCEMIHPWLDGGRLTAAIQKLNGRPDRRLVYLRISVS